VSAELDPGQPGGLGLMDDRWRIPASAVSPEGSCEMEPLHRILPELGGSPRAEHMSEDAPHRKVMRQSVRVFADFSGCELRLIYDYILMISKIIDKIPVYSYLLLHETVSRQFNDAINFACLEDYFYITTLNEYSIRNCEFDVNVIISDISHEIHYFCPIEGSLSIAKEAFIYKGEKKDIRKLSEFLGQLFTDIYAP
jgi:hypothetical protein